MGICGDLSLDLSVKAGAGAGGAIGGSLAIGCGAQIPWSEIASGYDADIEGGSNCLRVCFLVSWVGDGVVPCKAASGGLEGKTCGADGTGTSTGINDKAPPAISIHTTTSNAKMRAAETTVGL
jgi:hypothetical protein